MITDLATLPRYSLLDAPLLTAQAVAFGLPEESVERMVAIDRVLRSAAVAGILGPEAKAGWALSGPAALHGVYLRGSDLQRAPDELTFAPIAGHDTMAPGDLAALLSTALPEGAADLSDDSPVGVIRYAGISGPAVLPLRLESAPLAFEATTAARQAERPNVGYLYDRRLPYLPRVAQTPVAVPVAYVEELLLRLLGALAAPGNRPDVAARVDDLRLALLIEGADVRDALAGPVRDTLVTGLRARGLDGTAIRGRLDAIGAAVSGTVLRWSDPDALPVGLRPATVHYGLTERQAFESALDVATASLSRGTR